MGQGASSFAPKKELHHTKMLEATPEGNTKIFKSKSTTKESSVIISAKELKVTQSDFINEKDGAFRDSYKVGEVLGSGAFGEVRKCINRITGVKRAVKIMKKEYLDAEELDRFLHEIEILRKLDHPNIVRLYEFFQDEKRFYLVIELCTGGELFDEITKRPYFSEADAAKIIKQVLSAVAYCHSNNIAHRDLKPENLLIDEKGASFNIKVIDFGTSQRFDPSRKMKHAYGTPYYIAPEVLRGGYNEKCDVWSCGVILFVLLSGSPPFDGKDDKEILVRVKQGNFKMNSSEWKGVSKEAQDLIKKMLAFDPSKRISAEDALSHSWIKNKVEEDSKSMDSNFASVLNNLKNFRAEQKLQQAALTFIVSQLATREEMVELQAAFKALDKNSDGKLTREELLEGYKGIMGSSAEQVVDQIMAAADTDCSGAIDYSEFVTATMNKSKMLSNEKLEAAFSLFDKDKNGLISADEIRQVLGIGKNFSEEVWVQIVQEVDQNGDGEISFEEFKLMMEKFL